MTLVAFPPLEPIAGESGRELKLGRYPNKSYDERNGASSTVRGFGSLASGQELTISFGVVTDDQVSDVWLAWDEARGDYKALQLPDLFFFGIDPNLLAKIPSTIQWHFSPEMPRFSAAGPGYSKLNPITFIGELATQRVASIIVTPVEPIPAWFTTWLSQTPHGIPTGTLASLSERELFNMYGSRLFEETAPELTSEFLQH